MSQTIQAVVPVDLAERVARAAENEGRSVSSWVRRLLERELAGVPLAPPSTDAVELMEWGVRDMERRAAAETPRKRPALTPKGACPHPDLGPKRATSFGFARDCKVCGEVLPG